MIDKSDLDNYDKFARVIQKGDFNLKGEAIIPVALLLRWFGELKPKLKWAMEAGKEAEKDIEYMGHLDLTKENPKVEKPKKENEKK